LSLLKEQKNKISNQETEITSYQTEITSYQTEITKHKNQVANLKVLVEKLNRMLFGSKKEKFIKEPVDSNQLSLSFEEIVNKDQTTSEESVKQTITYERKKNENHSGRNKLPENLPVHEVVIEPAEPTQGMVKIGEERTEILELAPATFFKLVFIRPKYAKLGGEGVVIGELPSRPIEKCLAGNTLLASILINKYVDHLPLYRQQQIFKRSAITIAPSTIDGWVSQLGTLLEPLYNAMV